MRIRPAGESAVLVETSGLDEVMGLHAALRHAPPPGTVDLVPAARTVLVAFDRSATTMDRVVADLRGRTIDAARPSSGPLVELAVVYDGDDLAGVAELTGLTEREVVDRHCEREYVVAFCGFAPGFAYLTGGDPRLRVPRRANPRTAVPKGSVGLADEFTGLYPRDMPGGWQLIGRTDAVLWDLGRQPAALLPPDTRVRFVDQR